MEQQKMVVIALGAVIVYCLLAVFRVMTANYVILLHREDAEPEGWNTFVWRSYVCMRARANCAKVAPGQNEDLAVRCNMAPDQSWCVCKISPFGKLEVYPRQVIDPDTLYTWAVERFDDTAPEGFHVYKF